MVILNELGRDGSGVTRRGGAVPKSQPSLTFTFGCRDLSH